MKLNALGKLLCCIGCSLLMASCSYPLGECRLSPGILELASQARGLDYIEPVRCQTLSRKQMLEELKQVLYTKNKPEELLAEERVYSLIGIIPERYDYVAGILEGYNVRIKGFYHSEQNYFALGRHVKEGDARDVLLHELTHALQDQHYDIGKLLPSGIASDALLARLALLEGDAMRSVEIAQEKYDCGFYNEKTALVEAQHRLFQSDKLGMPKGLKLLMEFPYTHGLPFICEVERLAKKDQLEQLFFRPPSSTAEIIHPENYLKAAAEEDVRLTPEIGESLAPKNWIYSAVLGEYSIFSLLAAHLDVSSSYKAASGWVADRTWLYDGKTSERLHWLARWETEKDALEFAEAIKKQYLLRFPKSGVKSRSKFHKQEIELVSKRGELVIIQEGSEVRIDITRQLVGKS